jgi:hypothetical protein
MLAAIRCWYFNWTQIWLNYLSSFFTLHPWLSSWKWFFALLSINILFETSNSN